MVARFGSNELLAVANWWSKTYHYGDFRNYIVGNCFQWWPNEQNRLNMLNVAGFYPVTDENLERFAKMMIEDMKLVDVLGTWCREEVFFKRELENADRVQFWYIEPWWSNNPWTRALEDKKVLVIHPFIESIEMQYKRRDLLFRNGLILPKFRELSFIKAIQSNGGNNCSFTNWFDGLKWMEDEMDKIDFDIVLIGCGAYGFPLAAYAKKMGKKAVHMGGALQLLFGIKGKRWESPTYGTKKWKIPYGAYTNLMNEFWIRPDDKSLPKNPQSVEGACYW